MFLKFECRKYDHLICQRECGKACEVLPCIGSGLLPVSGETWPSCSSVCTIDNFLWKRKTELSKGFTRSSLHLCLFGCYVHCYLPYDNIHIDLEPPQMPPSLWSWVIPWAVSVLNPLVHFLISLGQLPIILPPNRSAFSKSNWNLNWIGLFYLLCIDLSCPCLLWCQQKSCMRFLWSLKIKDAEPSGINSLCLFTCFSLLRFIERRTGINDWNSSILNR